MTPDDETFLKNSLQELAQRLKAEPIKLEINIRRLRDEPELTKKVDGKLNRLSDPSYMFNQCAGEILYPFFKEDIIKEDVPPKLLVYCSRDSQVAKAALRQKPLAQWGATCSPLAAVYVLDNRVAMWHEALHLLGADDCYIEDNPSQKKSDCNLDGCIMEYAAPESTCENWPFLCDKNIELLSDLDKSWREQAEAK
jgi:hypothetical protein